jgi:hypothetical protein
MALVLAGAVMAASGLGVARLVAAPSCAMPPNGHDSARQLIARASAGLAAWPAGWGARATPLGWLCHSSFSLAKRSASAPHRSASARASFSALRRSNRVNSSWCCALPPRADRPLLRLTPAPPTTPCGWELVPMGWDSMSNHTHISAYGYHLCGEKKPCVERAGVEGQPALDITIASRIIRYGLLCIEFARGEKEIPFSHHTFCHSDLHR